MVIDHIRNRSLYYGMGEEIRKALDFFAQYHDDNPKQEDIMIPDSNVLVRVRPCMTESAEKRPFECHNLYADIHFVAAGLEGIGYADRTTLKMTQQNEKEDFALLEGKGDILTMPEGYFMITMPDDAHQPCVAVGKPCKINKLIAKIKVK